MNKLATIPRTLGHPLHIPSPTVSTLLAHRPLILQSLAQHGCITIKHVNFNQRQLIDFTKGIWNHVLVLPKFLCFNNQSEEYMQVARVGNVLLDGRLKDSEKEAAYWHQDGNFWGEDNKHIFNCLHTKEEPDVGGDTHVMDLRAAALFLKEKKPEIYKRLENMIGILNIEQINDFKLYNAKNTLKIDSITKHTLIRKSTPSYPSMPTPSDPTDPSTPNQPPPEHLFLSVHKLADKATSQESPDLKIQQVLKVLEQEMGYYAHKWEKGDLLIWDNLQVMHRSSGSFKGRRLLFRTQGKF